MSGLKIGKHLKQIAALIMTILLFFSSGAAAIAANAGNNTALQKRFTDIQNHWAENQILAWSDKGLVLGYDDNTFKPEKGVTRAEFVTFINRAFGFKQKAEITFSDISPKDWFSTEIARALAAGYIGGYDDGTMRPAAEISRQEAAAILFRLLKLDTLEEQEWVGSFADASDIAGWSREYVNAVVAGGYFNGYPDGTFRPRRTIRRAETVTLLDKVLGSLYNAPGTYGPAGDSHTIPGNATVNTAGVTLRNLVIEGDLFLAAGIGDGDFKADGVVVKGRTVIYGGGNRLIALDNSSLEDVLVCSGSGKTRIVAGGKTKIGLVTTERGGKLNGEEPAVDIELEGHFDSIVIESSANVTITGNSSVKNMEVTAQAGETNIKTSANCIINTLTLNATARVTNKGTITVAYVNTDHYDFETDPDILIVYGKEAKMKYIWPTRPIGSPGPTDPNGGSTIQVVEYAKTKKMDFDVEVDCGTSWEEAIAALAKTVEVSGTLGETGIASIKWTIEDFDGSTAGEYKAAGVLTLPANWTGTPDNVSAIVNVKEPAVPESLTLWLDAADYDQNNGVWKDKSGKENKVKQNNEASRPVKTTEDLNNRPVVLFDGDKYLELEWTDGSFAADSLTMFLVLENHDMDGGTQVVLGNYNTDNAVSISISSQNDSLVARISDYNHSCTFSSAAGPYVLTFAYNSKEMRTFVNGILSDTHETSEEIDWGKTAIGHSGAGEARAWKGQIAEIMIFAEMLEDDDQKELENYLYNKWLQPKEPRPLSDISFAVSPYLRAGSPGTAAGASIGSLSAADGYGSISYSLVSGDGDSDNGRFKIEGNSIIIQGADLTEGTYRFRVRAEDYYSRLEKSFSVTVFGGSVQIPGLVLHLDASALQGLEDKSPVESWEDLSGTGNHVSQDNPGSRPTYLANGLYGKPAVKFDGVDDYLNQPWTGTGGTLELEAATVFLVLKNENMSASQTMMGNYDEDGAVCFHISRNQNTFTATVSSRDNRIEFTDSLKPYVATYRVDGSSHQAFVNGVKIENENEKLAASINWGATTIGRNGGPLSSNVEEWYWEGSIAEIRSYNSALSDSERQAVENELQQKWFGSPGEARIYYNPYESVNWDTVKQYKANFHTHTTESDGRISPREVINAYSNAGYRILVITDHDSFGGADTTWPWTKWIDEEPDHINSNSGMETSVFYSNLGPGGMLAVRGNEISSTDHIGSFFSDYGGAAAGQEEYALQQIQGKNGLAMIYHPGRYNRSDSWYKELYKKYHQAPLIGMEVYNQGDRYGNDRNTWDRVNALVMPEIVIFGYSGDDMHYQEHRFRNYQFMLMEELTEEALREAMLKGAFYFCYESGGSGAPEPPVPRINRIEVSEDKTVITITASNADSIVWVTDKGEVARGASINLKDLNLNGAKFIRAELRNGKGVTHTQPFALAYIS